MLDSFGRGAIIALSALCVAGAFAFAPIRGRTSPDDARPRFLLAAAGPAARSIAIVPIRRDPFAQPPTPTPSFQPVAAANPSAAGTIGTLPPNLPSDIIPAVPGQAADATATSPRVTAIVTGPHPLAMLETGEAHEIKGVGDRVAGSTIVAIDVAGVRLQNGARLTIDATGSPR